MTLLLVGDEVAVDFEVEGTVVVPEEDVPSDVLPQAARIGSSRQVQMTTDHGLLLIRMPLR